MEAPKTAICKVDFDGWDWRSKFAIISPTGKRIGFEFNVRGQVTVGWFADNYPELCKKLFSHSHQLGFHDIEFTYAEMKVLLDLSNNKLKMEDDR